MIVHETWLVTLVKLVGQIPIQPPPAMRGLGRPPPTTPIKAIAWQRHAQIRPDDQQRGKQKHHEAFLVGTSMARAS
jgi:hypothetical protein